MGQLRIVLLAAFAITAFAGNSLLTRAGLAEALISPGAFAAIRLGAGAGLLAVLLALQGKRVLPDRRDAVGIASLLLYMMCFSFAYISLAAGTGALILFASVQLTIAVTSIARGETPTLRQVAGVLLALGGLAWIVSPGATAPAMLPAILMMTAGIGWGFYTLAGRSSSDALASTTRNFIGAAPVAVVIWALAPGEPMTAAGVGLAIVSGAITSGLGYAVWYAVLPALTRVTAGALQLLVPPLTALAGVVLLAEPITVRLVAASALVLFGVWLTITARKRV